MPITTRGVALPVIAGLILAALPRESAGQACADLSFGSPLSQATGSLPYAVAAADFNEDGLPDLAVANNGSNTVSILLGNGLGGFTVGPVLGITDPNSVAVGDFNKDGHADLALTTDFIPNIVVFLGTGAGGFGVPTSHPVAAAPHGVIAGDFDGDGKADLAAALADIDRVAVLLGTGTGSFGAATLFATAHLPTAVAAGDVNGDGELDLAVVNQADNNVSILLGDGAGAFGAAVHYATGTGPVSLVLADFDHDARLDMAVATGSYEPEITVRLGIGAGAFGPPAFFNSAELGGGASSVVTGDFDGDGHADLAVANFFEHSVSVLRGTGAGAFLPPFSMPAGTSPYDVVAADFDRDGRSDLAVANSGSSDVTVSLNDCTRGIADGTFEAGVPWPAWTTQTSTQFGTPLCDVLFCGTGGGTAPPRSGFNWAWFGGTPFAPETATLGQLVRFPASSELKLRFWMRIGYVAPPATDTLVLSVDGIAVQTFTEPSAPQSSYTLREADLTAFADGGLHALLFTYHHPDAGVANFTVDDVELAAILHADLSASKSDGQTEVAAGSVVTYSIAVTNNGPDRVTGVTVTDDFPASVDAISWHCTASSGSRCGAALGSGNIAETVDLDPGGTATYLAAVSIDPDATGSLVNTVRVAGAPTMVDPVPGNEVATDVDTLLPPADLSITKTDGLATAAPGQLLTYAVVAANAGPNAAAGATVTDPLPPSLTNASWTCAPAGGATCSPTGLGSIADTVHLPVGGSVTYTLSATVSAAPDHLRNTATVQPPAGVGDPDPADNSATDEDLLLCFAERILVPDGRTMATTLPAGATAWLAALLRQGNSYSVELQDVHGDGVPRATLTMFSGDDGCGGTSSMTPRETTGIDPATGSASRRVSFTASGIGTFFRARVVNGSADAIPMVTAWSDTTMFSPVWSDNGSFDTFYSFQNTTGSTLHGTLTLLGVGGAVVSSSPLTIAPGQTASTNTLALGVGRNQIGTARFTHDGPPGAILAEAAIGNFAINPAYVQPVRFQAVRESR